MMIAVYDISTGAINRVIDCPLSHVRYQSGPSESVIHYDGIQDGDDERYRIIDGQPVPLG